MTRGVRGAAPAQILQAVEDRNPLSGLGGFAGQLPDGRLVRDVLGREPLFVDGERWARSAQALPDPDPFPPGSMGLPTEEPTSVLSVPPSQPSQCDAALADLESAMGDALRSFPEATPVGFSGGLDSGLLAARSSGPGYVVGLPDAPDVATARKAANELDLELREVILSVEALRESIPHVAEAVGTTNPIDVAIAAGLYHLGTAIQADGFDRVLLGQGADELFGGYEKVAQAPDDTRVEANSILEARDEMIDTIPQQAARDVQVLRSTGVEPVMPYLEDGVVAAALQLPESALVSNGVRKTGLRRVAQATAPSSVVQRDKRALQYGSRISRELDRMAREDGYKRRQPNHVRRYIENRLETR